MFSEAFIKEAKTLYPEWESLHEALETGSPIVGRYLDDAQEAGVSWQEILRATSLEALKAKAKELERKNKLYTDYTTGRCYTDEGERRKELGCPRLYAQSSDDQEALDAFTCYGVGFIPRCPKFSTGECWQRFDEFGLKMC